jgi:hypothetical protein
MSNKTIRTLFLLGLLVAAAGLASGQRLVSSTPNGTLMARTINNFLNKSAKHANVQPSSVAVELRKIVYTSTDANGRRANLTGLLAMPVGGAPKGLIVFMHGTIWDRKASPSRLNAVGKEGEPMGAASILAPGGFAVVMPDYIGLGDHMAVHPYPVNVINAKAGADIIEPAREVIRRQRYNVGPNLFITGYSEGGGTAMALARELQNSGITVTATAPSSGPYDLSGVTRDYLLSEAKGQDLIARAYLLGYGVKYFESSHGVKMTDYFHPTMSRTINAAFKEGRSDKDIALRLAIVGTLVGATKSVERLLTERFLNALRNNDRSDPMIGAMAANDCYDWSPRSPMLLFSAAADRIVNPGNARKAYETMRRRGVGRDTMRWLSNEDPSTDHGKGFALALKANRDFFTGGFSAVPNAR